MRFYLISRSSKQPLRYIQSINKNMATSPLSSKAQNLGSLRNRFSSNALPKVTPVNQTRIPCRRQTVSVSAKFGGGSLRTSSPSVPDRVLAALPYLLPFLNAFTYGRYLFFMYPTLKAVIRPILPMVASFHSVPFASMFAFFGIYLGIVNNKNLSRFVRFNAMQAMLLDILLVLPRLLETIFTPPTSGVGLQIYANSQSFVWIFITAWVLFGISYSLMGTWARIPFVADAADQQVR